MGHALRRTRSAVADLVTVVHALPRPRRERCHLGHTLRQLDRVSRQVEQDPMDMDLAGRVGVVADEREAAGVHRDLGPLQAGRTVLAVAGTEPGNGPTRGERRGREDHANTLLSELSGGGLLRPARLKSKAGPGAEPTGSRV